MEGDKELIIQEYDANNKFQQFIGQENQIKLDILLKDQSQLPYTPGRAAGPGSGFEKVQRGTPSYPSPLKTKYNWKAVQTIAEKQKNIDFT